MKKTLSVLLTALLSVGGFSAFAAPSYSDNVAPLLSELKIMQGDPDGNMRLDDFVSRAECTKIVVAASKYRDMVAIGSKTSPFKDVTADHWAAPFVTVAVKNGLCKGYLDATFRPANTVLYEEALTMFLRVLGYSEEDFGSSWPDGQIGIGQNIGLCDDLEKSKGEALTRRDMMVIAYNLLNTPAKGAQQDYLSEFDRTITDDVVLISSGRENATIGTNKVLTSAGTFKITEAFDYSNIGRRGSISLRNGDTIVAFIPDAHANPEYADAKTCVVYSLLGNSVITYENGDFGKVDFTTGTVFYEDNQQTSYTAISQKLEMGDVLKIKYNDNGAIDYVVYEEGTTVGPVTVKSASWYTSFGADTSKTAVMRDGVKTTLSGVELNDIAYYSLDLDMFLVYSKKVTGIYESANPNKDTPSSVTVSGVTYDIEGVDAFTKLSSSGSFHYGDTVTLLLGKSGDVADVLTQSQMEDTVYGYLIETGRKDTTVNGTSVTKPYVKLILPSGESGEFVTAKEYDSILNSAVRVTFEGGEARVSKLPSQSEISGTFTWGTSARKLGSAKLSSDLEIIEVSTSSASEAGNAAGVFPARLSGMNISASRILYAGKNGDGEISQLILEDLTGDMHSYALVTSAKKNTNAMSISGSYTYLLGGMERTLSTNGKVYAVSSGQAVQIKTAANGSVASMTALTETARGKASTITGANLTLSGKTYRLSDSVSIYTKDDAYNYSMLTLEELTNNLDRYSIILYSDKTESLGGRVRVIVATPR